MSVKFLELRAKKYLHCIVKILFNWPRTARKYKHKTRKDTPKPLKCNKPSLMTAKFSGFTVHALHIATKAVLAFLLHSDQTT